MVILNQTVIITLEASLVKIIMTQNRIKAIIKEVWLVLRVIHQVVNNLVPARDNLKAKVNKDKANLKANNKANPRARVNSKEINQTTKANKVTSRMVLKEIKRVTKAKRVTKVSKEVKVNKVMVMMTKNRLQTQMQFM